MGVRSPCPSPKKSARPTGWPGKSSLSTPVKRSRKELRENLPQFTQRERFGQYGVHRIRGNGKFLRITRDHQDGLRRRQLLELDRQLTAVHPWHCKVNHHQVELVS